MIKYKIGDKIVFIGNPVGYPWNLNKYEQYEIINKAFDKTGKGFYGVIDTWYAEEDFISIKELRREKLAKLNEV